MKALRDKKFTKVNSDKKKISTEEEEEEEEDERDGNGKKKKSKKQLSREIKSIVDGKIPYRPRNTNGSLTTYFVISN